jgi:hypothetical protein
MQRETFTYWGDGVNDSGDIGVGGVQGYIGLVSGFRTNEDLSTQYRGVSSAGQLGVNGSIPGVISIGGGAGGFVSWTDPMLRGSVIYVGGSIFSLDISEGLGFDIMPTMFYFDDHKLVKYAKTGEKTNRALLMSDILLGNNSPLSLEIKINDVTVSYSHEYVNQMRIVGGLLALKYADVYDDLRYEN